MFILGVLYLNIQVGLGGCDAHLPEVVSVHIRDETVLFLNLDAYKLRKKVPRLTAE